MTTTRLDPILEDVRRRAAARRRLRPLASLRAEVDADPSRRERFVAALGRPGLAIVAECKRRSPSAGRLAAEDDLLPRARAYAAGGAAALSVLTEEDHFGGRPDDIARVAGAGRPVLRKDFVLDEGMVLESAAWGADAVLLLAVVLGPGRLAELAAVARETGLATLVEIHDEDELDAAVAAAPDALGVNARDLRTFAVDLSRVEALVPRLPAGTLRVAESGVGTAGDVARVRAAGADAVLVGGSLMRADDPAATLAAWREVCGA